MPTQLQQQPNVTYMHSVHQPPPVVPQQNQQVLQGGLSVTRSEAALLTTNQQQPQQQLPQQQQMVNAQTSYNYLAQPVPQYSHPGMPTTTFPPLALHAPHPPPLQSLRIEQERVANLRAQEDRAAEEERAAAAADFAATAGGMDNPPPFTEAGTGAPPPVNNDRTHAAAGSSSQQQQGTVHWRVQICHKSLSVVYYIKKWFLLIYLLTAGRSESEPCYLYINALCRGAITKAATTEIMVKIGVMQHKQLLVIKKVVALGRNFSERK